MAPKTRKKMSHNSWDVELHPEGMAEYKCIARQLGGSSASVIVQVPKDVAIFLGIVPGDVVGVVIRKAKE